MFSVPSKNLISKKKSLELNYSCERNTKIQIYKLHRQYENRQNDEEKPSFYIKYIGDIKGKLGIESKKVYQSPDEIMKLK